MVSAVIEAQEAQVDPVALEDTDRLLPDRLWVDLGTLADGGIDRLRGADPMAVVAACSR